ncbi:hypothetical protein [Streptomyces sp. SYSU K217416]
MVSGKFTADPDRMRLAGELMKALPGRADKIADDFISDVQNYSGWAGYDDDFANKVLPKYGANNEACLELIRTLAMAFLKLQQAVWANAQHIEGVSEYANDQVNSQLSKLDGGGVDSTEGGRS